jgi:ADP-ribose pyrophosphatase YjhB (NUDIX family)
MTTDIFTSSAVDLVIFTVIDQSKLPSQLWDDSLVSFGAYKPDLHDGLSLFVVTIPADLDLYPNLKGKRVLPGGYLGKNETLASASNRIAQERLGLSLKTKIRQLGTFDEPERDPRGRILSFAYWAMIDFAEIRKYLGGRDQIGLELVNSHEYMYSFERSNQPLYRYDGVCRFGNRTMPSPSSFRGHAKTLTDELPGGPILGLDHDLMVFYAWRALRHAFDGRLDPFRYLGLNPIGQEFRISQLQDFTEVCRGETIQRDLFKRQMLSGETFLLNTGKTDRSKPGKPSNLYKHVNDDIDLSDI